MWHHTQIVPSGPRSVGAYAHSKLAMHLRNRSADPPFRRLLHITYSCICSNQTGCHTQGEKKRWLETSRPRLQDNCTAVLSIAPCVFVAPSFDWTAHILRVDLCPMPTPHARTGSWKNRRWPSTELQQKRGSGSRPKCTGCFSSQNRWGIRNCAWKTVSSLRCTTGGWMATKLFLLQSYVGSVNIFLRMFLISPLCTAFYNETLSGCAI